MEPSVIRAYKKTPFYWNSMDMRDRKNVMTSYPKEDVIKLNELT